MYYLTQKLKQALAVIKRFKLLFISILVLIFCGVCLWNISIMEEDNFLVHLTSNVRLTNPDQMDNSIGNYITHIAKKINLTDDWEVGLTEISYTKSWYNILEDENIAFIDSNGNIHQAKKTLSAGYYKNITELIDEINEILLNIIPALDAESRYFPLMQPPVLRYNEIRNAIEFTIGYLGEKVSEEKVIPSIYVIPYFSNFLSGILGFIDSQDRKLSWENFPPNLSIQINTDERATERDIVVEAFSEVQLDAAIRALYIYCSIIEPVLCGNSYAQLLRPVEIPNESIFGDQCVIKYQNPYYLPLLFNEIDVIEIDIRDDTNKPINFAFGRTIVTLQFRKRIKNGIESIYQLLR
jgi:hypothetical protein